MVGKTCRKSKVVGARAVHQHQTVQKHGHLYASLVSRFTEKSEIQIPSGRSLSTLNTSHIGQNYFKRYQEP